VRKGRPHRLNCDVAQRHCWKIFNAADDERCDGVEVLAVSLMVYIDGFRVPRSARKDANHSVRETSPFLGRTDPDTSTKSALTANPPRLGLPRRGRSSDGPPLISCWAGCADAS